MPGSPPISEELRELLSLLNSHHVDYIVVGSHALAYYGVPRFTEDVDFFLARNQENVLRLAAALKEFGIELTENAQDEILEKDRGILFLGNKPNRVDFLTFLDGVDFETASRCKSDGTLANEPVSYISIEHYIASKKAAGRPKDFSDLALLKSARPEIEI